MRIEQVKNSDFGVERGINNLLPQLSENIQEIRAARLYKITQQKNFVLLVAKEGGRILGMASIFFVDLLSKRTAWIEDVVVDESARGQGIAQALTEQLIEIAQEHKADEINLTSRPERVAANKLYENLGFEKRNTNIRRLKL